MSEPTTDMVHIPTAIQQGLIEVIAGIVSKCNLPSNMTLLEFAQKLGACKLPAVYDFQTRSLTLNGEKIYTDEYWEKLK